MPNHWQSLFPIFLMAATVASAQSPDLPVIAVGGLHQLADPDHPATGACAQTTILPPIHGFLRNTLAGIANAYRHGADWVQVDVRISADDVPVLFADDELSCRTGAPGTVRTTTWSQLSRLHGGHGLRTRSGERPLTCSSKHPGFERCLKAGRIPRLSEVLRRFPERGLVLSLPASVQDPGPILATIRKAVESGLTSYDHLLLTSPDPAVLAVVSGTLPGLSHSGLGADEASRCLTTYMTSRALGDSCRKGLFIVPFPDFKALGITAVNLAREVHGSGGHLHVSGIDGRTELEYVRRFPVDAIWTGQMLELERRRR